MTRSWRIGIQSTMRIALTPKSGMTSRLPYMILVAPPIRHRDVRLHTAKKRSLAFIPRIFGHRDNFELTQCALDFHREPIDKFRELASAVLSNIIGHIVN